jgi:hypothetical protein
MGGDTFHSHPVKGEKVKEMLDGDSRCTFSIETLYIRRMYCAQENHFSIHVSKPQRVERVRLPARCGGGYTLRQRKIPNESFPMTKNITIIKLTNVL